MRSNVRAASINMPALSPGDESNGAGKWRQAIYSAVACSRSPASKNAFLPAQACQQKPPKDVNWHV